MIATLWSSQLNEIRFLARANILKYTSSDSVLPAHLFWTSAATKASAYFHFATSSNATSERSFYANMSQLADSVH